MINLGMFALDTDSTVYLGGQFHIQVILCDLFKLFLYKVYVLKMHCLPQNWQSCDVLSVIVTLPSMWEVIFVLRLFTVTCLSFSYIRFMS